MRIGPLICFLSVDDGKALKKREHSQICRPTHAVRESGHWAGKYVLTRVS